MKGNKNQKTKDNTKQPGAELGQVQLKLGVGLTLTYLNQIDEQETLKHPLAIHCHLLFTAPTVS